MGKPESFGDYLRREREARGVSRDDISKATKISRNILEALESDDYHFLPEETFVRGYIRTYARELGLSPEDMVRQFQDFKTDSGQEAQGKSEEERRSQKASIFTGSPRGKIYIFLFCLLGGAVLLLFLCLEKQKNEGKQREIKPTEEEVIAPAPVSFPVEFEVDAEEVAEKQETEPPPSPGFSPGKKVPLVLHAREEVWVKFSIDGSQAQEILLRPGERYIIRGQNNFDLLIGNAGGVELIFDGKPLPALGSSGRVVHLRLPIPKPEE